MVDWKSSQNRIQDPFQIRMYAWGVGASRAMYHYLDRSRPGDVIHEIELVPAAHVLQRIRATDAIKSAIFEEGTYPRFLPSPLCAFCASQNACPARGMSQVRQANAAQLRRDLRSHGVTVAA